MTPITVTRFAIGAPFPIPFEGTSYNYTVDGHHFVFVVDRPTKHEVRLFSHGPLRITYTRERHVLFAIVDFGEGFAADASYDWWLNPVSMRPDLDNPSNILQLSLVDQNTGRLAAGRMLGLRDSPIVEALRDVSSREPVAETRAVVDDVYRRCPSHDAMRLCQEVVVDQRFPQRR